MDSEKQQEPDLTPEPHRDMRPGSHVRSGWRGLLARQPAAHSFEFEASILSSFHGSADGLADE